MDTRLAFSIAFGVVCSIGSLLIFLGTPKRLSLNEFYTSHPVRHFSDNITASRKRWSQVEVGTLLRQFIDKASRSHRVAGVLVVIQNLLDLANLPGTASSWLTQAIFFEFLAIVATVALLAISHITILILLPILVPFMLYTRLSRAARLRKERIQRQLPQLLSLMGASADILPTLDGRDGVLAWSVRTMRGDATNLFRDLIIQADAQNIFVEDVFDEAARRFKINELSILGQTFRIYHSQGVGLADTFKQVAAQWEREQGQLLATKMRHRGFMAQIMVLICYVPVIIALLLAPAVFHVISALHGVSVG